MEKLLITHCSPTLASIKTANLFSCGFTSEAGLIDSLLNWRQKFSGTGIDILPLKIADGRALIYVYRRSMLEKDLNRPGVHEFLSQYGYDCSDIDLVLKRLCSRIPLCGSFPHEIGLFLGYPLSDVVGFINNCGRNYKCCGCWKVYSNESEARKVFAKFDRCRKIYNRLWREGRSVLQLTVVA